MSIAATAASTVLAIAFLSVPLLVDGQDSPPTCADLGSGIFYSYPKNTHGRYAFLREGTREKEFNLDTGDSTVWEIQWQGDCRAGHRELKKSTTPGGAQSVTFIDAVTYNRLAPCSEREG